MRSELRQSKRRLLRLGIFASLTTACWLFSWVAAKALIVRRDLPHADAIVVLAGSSTYLERARLAADLFNQRTASTIILTNDGLISGWLAAEERNPLFVERTAAELQRLGVPQAQIKIIPRLVTSTRDEARAIQEYADRNALRSLLLVTTPYQSRRALFIFDKTFQDSRVTIGLDAPPPGVQSPRPAIWWASPLGWKLVPGEYFKILYYKFKY